MLVVISGNLLYKFLQPFDLKVMLLFLSVPMTYEETVKEMDRKVVAALIYGLN
ncbi:hypothetical protein [Paenibacillus shirakamiensis]|uniref:hypothetical protein n=1 Tax=Paenibacillus shirakamiensis TaxID=1265935 RepID=UPI001AE32F7A|nr:hypothetical protein [Paenibacillus shirakamiensis]